MIEGFTLTEELVRIEDKFDHWEDAVRASSEALLKQGFVKQSYIEAMIDSVKEFGPYIIIAPNIAMPHARPTAGAIQIGFSVMIVQQPVIFGEDDFDKAQIFIALSCVTSDTHLKMMQALVEVIEDESKVEKLIQAKTKKEIIALFT